MEKALGGTAQTENGPASEPRDFPSQPSQLVSRAQEKVQEFVRALGQVSSAVSVKGQFAPDTLSASEIEIEEGKEPSREAIIDFGYRRLFVRDLVQATPGGTLGNPSMILEIGGGNSARPYDQRELDKRNILIGNIDFLPGWGDRQTQCDLDELKGGLNDPMLETMFKDTSLGTVVMSNVIKFLKPETFKEIAETAFVRLKEGGKFVAHDMNITEESARQIREMLTKKGLAPKGPTGEEYDFHAICYSRILAAFQYLNAFAKEQPENFRVQHFALGAAVSGKITRKLYDHTFKPEQLDTAIAEGHAVLVKIPIDAASNEAIAIGNKTLFPMFFERIVEVEKIDHEKEGERRHTHNRQQREQRRKEKEKRKQSRKRH